MNHAFKNVVIALSLICAGFLIAWLRYRPHLGTEGSFTDGVQEYQSVTDEPLRYALWDEANILEGMQGDDEASQQFDPCLSPDGQWMVFAVGERGLGTDLWIAPMEGDTPGAARSLYELNSPADEVAPAFGRDGLFFASNREGGAGGMDLWQAKFTNGIFDAPERLPDTLNTFAEETDPAPLPGSDGLLFASNRKAENRRDYDLYMAYGSGPNAYQPSRIAELNSDFNERDPAFTADGRTLFFASNRTNQNKDYDLFRSVLDRNDWLEPKPVNGLGSTGSERGPQPSPDGFSLLFSVEDVSDHADTESGGLPSNTSSTDARLFSAQTRELFLRPGKTIGLFEVLLLLALLLLALLAWLAKRWTTVEVIYRCFLVSLIAHALLMWWFQDVVPEDDPMQLVGESPTYQVSLARNSNAPAAENQERSGELSAERTADEPSETQLEREQGEIAETEAQATPTVQETSLAPAPSALPDTEAAVAERAESVESTPEVSLADASTPAPLYEAAAPEVTLKASPSSAPTKSPSGSAGGPVREESTANGSNTNLRPAQTPQTQSSGLARRLESDLPASGETSAEEFQPASNAAGVVAQLQGPMETFAPTRNTSKGVELPTPRTSERSEGSTQSSVAPARSTAGTGSPSERTSLSEALGAALPSTAASSGSAPSALANSPARMPAAKDAQMDFEPSATPSTESSRLALHTPTDRVSSPGAEQQATAEESSSLALPSMSGQFKRNRAQSTEAPRRFQADASAAPARPTSAPIAALDMPIAKPTPIALPKQEVPFQKTPYRNRFGLAKERALEQLGGGAETEAAVASGLAYLASIQHGIGFWGQQQEVYEKYRNLRIGKTGLCLLAFLGASHTHQSGTQYSEVAQKAIAYLLNSQDRRTGHFGNSSAYGHGVATYALAECFALTQDETLRVPLKRAVAHILKTQSRNRDDARFFGGWTYYYPDDDVYDAWPRVSVTSWQVMALESSRLGGLEVPRAALEDARTFLNNAWDQNLGAFRYNHAPSRLRMDYATLPASTPAALFALSLLGEDLTDPSYGQARMFLLERIPSRYAFEGEKAFVERASGNLYFWYYSSLALLRVGGDSWKKWNEGLKATLLPSQNEDGSWEPISIYAGYAGDSELDKSYTTAMCVLSLEVYYRYFTPLLQGDD